jgi:hypothetical protein
MTGSGIHHVCSVPCRHLSPLPGACGTITLPLPATGRGWAHSPFTVAAAGAWKESGWLDLQGLRECDPLPAKSRSSEHAGDCLHCRLKVRWRGPATDQAGSQSVASSEPQIADAGAARQPTGPEQGLREPDGVPREAQPAPPGPGGTGPRAADEAPAYPSHLGGFPCGAGGAWGASSVARTCDLR